MEFLWEICNFHGNFDNKFHKYLFQWKFVSFWNFHGNFISIGIGKLSIRTPLIFHLNIEKFSHFWTSRGKSVKFQWKIWSYRENLFEIDDHNFHGNSIGNLHKNLISMEFFKFFIKIPLIFHLISEKLSLEFWKWKIWCIIIYSNNILILILK